MFPSPMLSDNMAAYESPSLPPPPLLSDFPPGSSLIPHQMHRVDPRYHVNLHLSAEPSLPLASLPKLHRDLLAKAGCGNFSSSTGYSPLPHPSLQSSSVYQASPNPAGRILVDRLESRRHSQVRPWDIPSSTLGPYGFGAKFPARKDLDRPSLEDLWSFPYRGNFSLTSSKTESLPRPPPPPVLQMSSSPVMMSGIPQRSIPASLEGGRDYRPYTTASTSMNSMPPLAEVYSTLPGVSGYRLPGTFHLQGYSKVFQDLREDAAVLKMPSEPRVSESFRIKAASPDSTTSIERLQSRSKTSRQQDRNYQQRSQKKVKLEKHVVDGGEGRLQIKKELRLKLKATNERLKSKLRESEEMPQYCPQSGIDKNFAASGQDMGATLGASKIGVEDTLLKQILEQCQTRVADISDCQDANIAKNFHPESNGDAALDDKSDVKRHLIGDGQSVSQASGDGNGDTSDDDTSNQHGVIVNNMQSDSQGEGLARTDENGNENKDDSRETTRQDDSEAARSDNSGSLDRPGSEVEDRRLFRCPQCRYVTDRKNNLKRHVVTMHGDSQKAQECCGIVFRSKAALRDHVTLFHRGGYRCQICGRNFCRKALLRRHLTVHSGQKDFRCALCGYATSHKSNLERHHKVHARRPTFPRKVRPPATSSPGPHPRPLPPFSPPAPPDLQLPTSNSREFATARRDGDIPPRSTTVGTIERHDLRMEVAVNENVEENGKMLHIHNNISGEKCSNEAAEVGVWLDISTGASPYTLLSMLEQMNFKQKTENTEKLRPHKKFLRDRLRQTYGTQQSGFSFRRPLERGGSKNKNSGSTFSKKKHSSVPLSEKLEQLVRLADDEIHDETPKKETRKDSEATPETTSIEGDDDGVVNWKEEIKMKETAEVKHSSKDPAILDVKQGTSVNPDNDIPMHTQEFHPGSVSQTSADLSSWTESSTDPSPGVSVLTSDRSLLGNPSERYCTSSKEAGNRSSATGGYSDVIQNSEDGVCTGERLLGAHNAEDCSPDRHQPSETQPVSQNANTDAHVTSDFRLGCSSKRRICPAPYKCNDCQTSFSRQEDMTSHDCRKLDARPGGCLSLVSALRKGALPASLERLPDRAET